MSATSNESAMGSAVRIDPVRAQNLIHTHPALGLSLFVARAQAKEFSGDIPADHTYLQRLWHDASIGPEGRHPLVAILRCTDHAMDNFVNSPLMVQAGSPGSWRGSKDRMPDVSAANIELFLKWRAPVLIVAKHWDRSPDHRHDCRCGCAAVTGATLKAMDVLKAEASRKPETLFQRVARRGAEARDRLTRQWHGTQRETLSNGCALNRVIDDMVPTALEAIRALPDQGRGMEFGDVRDAVTKQLAIATTEVVKALVERYSACHPDLKGWKPHIATAIICHRTGATVFHDGKGWVDAPQPVDCRNQPTDYKTLAAQLLQQAIVAPVSARTAPQPVPAGVG